MPRLTALVRPVAVVLTVGACVAALTGSGPAARPAAPVTVPPAVWAYLTGESVVLLTGTTERAHAVGNFSLSRPGALRFTADGRFAFAVAAPATPRARVAAIDVLSGRVVEVPCGCQEAVAVGDSRVLWTGDEPGARVADLAGPTGTAPWRIPAGPSGTTPRPLAAVDGNVLWTFEPVGDVFRSTVVFADAAGRVRWSAVENGIVVAAGGAWRSALAYVLGGSGDGCQSYQRVVVVDPASGTRTPVAASPGSVGRLPGAGGEHVEDLWWGPDGRLHLIMRSWTCDGAEFTVRSAGAVWRLAGGAWQSVDRGPVFAARSLGARVRAVVRMSNPTADASSDSGSLTVEVPDRRIPVGAGVRAVAVPPPARPDPAAALTGDAYPEGGPACRASAFDDGRYPGARVGDLKCGDGVALVTFTGTVGARGRQSELWVTWPGGWEPRVSGTGPAGELSSCDIEQSGLQLDQVRARLPGWQPAACI